MKKKVLVLITLFLVSFLLVGCTSKKDSKAALDFKKEYEAVNGKEAKMGMTHRTIKIDKDNPFEKVEPKKIVELLDKKESFYLYIGDPYCPWCRSVIEKAVEVAKAKKVKKVYYIDFWDDDWNEILRDKYEFKDGKLVKTVEATKEYERMLKEFGPLLRDYTVTDENGNEVEVGEKRAFGATFIAVKKGKAVRMTEGHSKKQKGAFDELTDEILDDEEEEFNKLFSN